MAELGVCLGYSREVPGAFDFIVSNGSIFPRRVVNIVQVHPFDWKRKTVLRAELRLPSVEIDALPAIQPQVPIQGVPIQGVRSIVTDLLNPVAALPVAVSQRISLPVDRVLLPSVPINDLEAQELHMPVVDHVSEILDIAAPVSVAPNVVSVASPSSGRPVRSNSGVSYEQRRLLNDRTQFSGSSNFMSAVGDDSWCNPRRSVPYEQARQVYLDRSIPIELESENCFVLQPLSTVVKNYVKQSAKRIFPKRRVDTDALTSEERVCLDAMIAVNFEHWGYALDTQRDDELDLNQVLAKIELGESSVFSARVDVISSSDLIPIPVQRDSLASGTP